MKKIIALLLAVIMLLSMAACGGKEAEKEPEVPVTEAPEKPTEPPVTTVTKSVVLDLKGRADEGACSVRVICNTQEIYNETVEQGTASIVLENQTGSETVKYTVILNETDTWDEMVDFTS